MISIRAFRQHLQRYNPGVERVLFGLSLLGILDVVHLYLQKEVGFEQGCFGVSALGAGANSAFDCATVTSGPASHFLGVSNITWGLGFYVVVAVLTVLLFTVRPVLREWIHGGRITVLTCGLLYSGYLVYLQVGPIEAFCALCLVSAGIVTLLFGAQIAVLIFSSSSVELPMPSRPLKRQVTTFVYFVAAAVVLAGVDLTYFNAWDGTPNQSPSESSVAASSSSAPQCQLDTTIDPLDDEGASLVTFQDITKGNSDADVTVIEYFDPNCPHCKDYHQTMKKLVEAYQEEVRFVYKPFALRRSSIPEIQALYVAHQSGKFSEMLDGQYARQGPGGINMSDLRSIASEIGMDPNVLSTKIEENAFRNFVLQVRKRAASIGVNSTPTVVVNGHFTQSRSLDCMKTFIKRAQQGTLASSSSE